MSSIKVNKFDQVDICGTKVRSIVDPSSGAVMVAVADVGKACGWSGGCELFDSWAIRKNKLRAASPELKTGLMFAPVAILPEVLSTIEKPGARKVYRHLVGKLTGRIKDQEEIKEMKQEVAVVEQKQSGDVSEFFFGSSQVRTVLKEGTPWFVAADVCEALGLQNPAQVVSKLDADEKGICSVYTLGGEQELAAVTESGLYALTLRCRDAMTPGTTPHRFRKWVTSDVLPTIRKTGTYSVSQFKVPATYVEALRLAADQEEKLVAQQLVLTEQAPKVKFFDTVVDSKDLFDLGDVAKMMGTGRNRLFDLLRTKGVLFKRAGNNHVYQPYITAGYLTEKIVSKTGERGVAVKVLVTGKGLPWIEKNYPIWAAA